MRWLWMVVLAGCGAWTPGETVEAVPPAVVADPIWEMRRDFNSGPAGASVKGKPDGMGNTAAVYDATHYVEGGMAAKTTITPNTGGFGSWGGVVKFPTPLVRYDTLWVQVWLYVPDDFQVYTNNGSLKFLRIRSLKADNSHTGYLDWYIENDRRQVPGRTQYRLIKEGQQVWYPFGPILSLTRAQWHKFTWHIVFDAVPGADGGQARVRAWQDDVLLQDENRVRTMNAEGDIATALYIFTLWNGNSAPQTQSVWLDDIRIAHGCPSWAPSEC